MLNLPRVALSAAALCASAATRQHTTRKRRPSLFLRNRFIVHRDFKRRVISNASADISGRAAMTTAAPAH